MTNPPTAAVEPGPLHVVRVGAAPVAAAKPTELQTLLTGHGRVLLADSADDKLAQRAVKALLGAGLDAHSLVVQTVRTGAALAVLAKAGARRIEWPVATAVPGTPGFALLLEAIGEAGRLGLTVHLRWTVDAAAARALAGLQAWSQPDTDALAAAAAQVAELVLQPALGSRAPSLCDVEAQWPAWPQGARPTLVRSQRWPACLLGACQQVEPASTRQLAEDQPRFVGACDSCALRGKQCPGMAGDLADALARSGQTWPGLRGAHSAASGDGKLQFDPQCAEVRGLRLGVRRAWRLRLKRGDIADFCQAARDDGWEVNTSDLPVAVQVGGHMAVCEPHAAGASWLAVVAVDRADVLACLQDEWALITAPVCETEQQAAEMLARHRRLGDAYGFPPCCVEAFCDAFVETLAEHPDSDNRAGRDNALTLARATLRSAHFDSRLATLAGILGESNPTPLRHLPCRFDCAASIALATQLGEAGQHTTARPALVLQDGSFAWLEGTWQPDEQVVDAVRAVHTVGWDPAALPWQRAFAAPLDWDALRVAPGELQLRRAGTWASVDSGQRPPFPLILPFSAHS